MSQKLDGGFLHIRHLRQVLNVGLVLRKVHRELLNSIKKFD